MKPTSEQVKNARRIFNKTAWKYPRALEQLQKQGVREHWVHFVARCLQHGNAEAAERRLIKYLHRVTLKLEKEAAGRVQFALLRRADETR